jgi:hypothetical protein
LRDGIELARRLLESRRSELERRAVWSRLGMPAPMPVASAASAIADGIPLDPVYIQAIHLRDVRGIQELKLEPKLPSPGSGQWIVLLGPNGAGKSTILRSLVLSLRNIRDPMIWPKGTFADPWERLPLRVGGNGGGASMSVVLNDGVQRTTSVRSSAGVTLSQSPVLDEPRLFPLFAYGSRRGSALGGAPREVVLGEDDGPEVATLFDEGAALIHAETWLLQWYGDAARNQSSYQVLEATLSALVTFLDIEGISFEDRRVWVTEKSGVRIPFGAMSDGALTSAGWLLDLIARWLAIAMKLGTAIDASFMAKMTGIVLIDELDLHLHPRWQVEVIGRTRQLLPKMSFVVTTHNPLTLIGAKAEEIWVLQAGETGVCALPGTEAPMFLTGGQLYQQYFGIADIYPNEIGFTNP